MVVMEVWSWASSAVVCYLYWDRPVSICSSLELTVSRDDWVVLAEVWSCASSAAVCCLCSWKHILRLLTETLRLLRSFLRDLTSLICNVTKFLSCTKLALMFLNMSLTVREEQQ